MSTLFGFMMGLLKNFIFVGFSAVEAFVFRIVWNYLVIAINAFVLLQFDYVTHFSTISYYQSWAFFILIHFIGQFISKVSPFSVSVKSKSENNEKEK